jgi:hypothetical protein
MERGGATTTAVRVQDAMDDASPRHVDGLKRVAQGIGAQHDAALAALAHALPRPS